MSNVLFGLDIAKIVNDAVSGAGGVLDATLIKRENAARTPGNLTGGRNPTETSHACKGFMDNQTNTRRSGTLVTEAGIIVSILGNSLPADVVPEQGDRVTIENMTFEIVGVPQRDPAAALYECEVR